MNDQQLRDLCVYEEASGEPTEGQAGVAQVLKNRIALRYKSDGTMAGTVLGHDQFSWAYFNFVTRHSGTGTHEMAIHAYQRVASTPAQAQAIAEKKLATVLPRSFAAVGVVASQVFAGSFHGPLFDKLGNGAVLYLNPRILTKLPAWADPKKLIVSIGHHDFYGA